MRVPGQTGTGQRPSGAGDQIGRTAVAVPGPLSFRRHHLEALLLLLLAGSLGGCATIPEPGKGRPSGPVIDDVAFERIPAGRASQGVKEAALPTPEDRPLTACRTASIAIDETLLAEGLANHAPRGTFSRNYARFDPLAVELDHRRIVTYYHRQGDYAVRVKGPFRIETDDPDVIKLKYTIHEGRPVCIVDHVVEGPRKIRPLIEAELSRIEAIGVGRILNYEAYARAKQSLRTRLVRGGYADAQVDGRVEVDREHYTAVLAFEVNPGLQVRLRHLIVTGNVRTPTSAVTSRQTWKEGDVFDPTLLRRLQSRLYPLDHYEGISPRRVDADAPVTDIEVVITEANRNELQLGLGLGLDPTNFEVRGRAQYKRRSFLFPMMTLSTQILPGYSVLRDDFSQRAPIFEGRVTLDHHDVPAPRFKLSHTAGFSITQIEAYTIRAGDGGQTLSRGFFEDRLQAALGWRFFSYGFFDQKLDEEENAALDFTESLIFLEPSLTYEGRDNATEPRRGLWARLSAEVGYGFRTSGGLYARITPELRGYLPLGNRVVLAARARLGVHLTDLVPATRRYFAGGANSQRGFALRRVSPLRSYTDSDGRMVIIPIGGIASFETTLEGRVDLFEVFGYMVGIAAFLDGADVTEAVGDLDPLNLLWAAGGGLRYRTPIGAIRFDIAHRINNLDLERVDDGSEPWAWHLTLGEAF